VLCRPPPVWSPELLHSVKTPLSWCKALAAFLLGNVSFPLGNHLAQGHGKIYGIPGLQLRRQACRLPRTLLGPTPQPEVGAMVPSSGRYCTVLVCGQGPREARQCSYSGTARSPSSSSGGGGRPPPCTTQHAQKLAVRPATLNGCLTTTVSSEIPRLDP
jgi:hypothetical protein